MPSSGQRRKGPGPLTASASYTEAAGVTGPGDLRVPGDPRAADKEGTLTGRLVPAGLRGQRRHRRWAHRECGWVRRH